MQAVKAGFVYFCIVFGAGFLLGLIRVPLLVPRYGVRTAELLEMPVMLAVIFWASQRLARGNPSLSRFGRLSAGVLALGLLVTAEVLLTLSVGDQSLSQYLASRDPVSGSVYLASLCLFAVAPALWRPVAST